nr:hypothetical protein Iba_chr01dCG13240 [Ipomoea batatas]GMC54863.1 hypothetical protein Iba_chr01eCG1960 [Ipomoea batatas]GMC55979.1 hypothetical protein Iba_chr01fCG2790 [Ipomoea batatas]
MNGNLCKYSRNPRVNFTAPAHLTLNLKFFNFQRSSSSGLPDL